MGKKDRHEETRTQNPLRNSHEQKAPTARILVIYRKTAGAPHLNDLLTCTLAAL